VDYVQAVYLFHRDLGKYILAASQNREAVLLSSPNSSILTAGVGGFKTIGTHYWENTQGLKNTYKALASQTSQEAYQHMVNLGVTHIALLSWGGISEDLLELISKETDKRHVMQNTFYYRCLFAEELPLWVKPMPVPPHPYAEKLGIKFLLLEFAPEQKPEEAFYHAARYLLYSKRNSQAAINLYKKALEIRPDFADAQRELLLLQQTAEQSLKYDSNHK
jgi:tetratricopeptide (TPR) repeat protein